MRGTVEEGKKGAGDGNEERKNAIFVIFPLPGNLKGVLILDLFVF